ncbi:hypothetical protein ALC62_15745 [Cyphomyrmex costatus]|uniref:Uncharacterized protein n=1 Tax=Cyphomyrmex costatus TaxID=456900 RepID=A0A151I6B3_9HYME|nr:hypothetical protein ALC62_15745 [Cyphomyrmex costatus]
MLDIRPVTVTLSKHGRVPTVKANFFGSSIDTILMLDTRSRPNIIKETFIPKNNPINCNNILKLNGINEYPVYTLGEITVPLFGKLVTFHAVPNDFPISQSGILGNDFFEQTSSKIDYAKGHLDASGMKVPFLSPETIIAYPRSESSFYVRIEIKIGYIPRIKIAHGLYLGDTIVENIAGKAYLKVISTLDEEIEVQVPTLRLNSLNELFDAKDEITNKVSDGTFKENNKEDKNEKEKTFTKIQTVVKNNGNYTESLKQLKNRSN